MEFRLQILENVHVIVRPFEMGHELSAILKNLNSEMSGKFYHPYGFIKENSIEIVKYSAGVFYGSHVNGNLRYDCTIRCRIFCPIPGDEIICKILSVEKDAIVCQYMHLDAAKYADIVYKIADGGYDTKGLVNNMILKTVCRVVRYNHEINKYLVLINIVDVYQSYVRTMNLAYQNSAMVVQFYKDEGLYTMISAKSYHGKYSQKMVDIVELLHFVKIEHNIEPITKSVFILDENPDCIGVFGRSSYMLFNNTNILNSPGVTNNGIIDGEKLTNMIEEFNSTNVYSNLAIVYNEGVTIEQIIANFTFAICTQNLGGTMIFSINNCVEQYNILIQFIASFYKQCFVFKSSGNMILFYCHSLVNSDLNKQTLLALNSQIDNQYNIEIVDMQKNVDLIDYALKDIPVPIDFGSEENPPYFMKNGVWVPDFTDLPTVKDIEDITIESVESTGVSLYNAPIQTMDIFMTEEARDAYKTKARVITNPKFSGALKFDNIFYTCGDVEDLINHIFNPLFGELTNFNQQGTKYIDPNNATKDGKPIIDSDYAAKLKEFVDGQLSWENWDMSPFGVIETINYMFNKHYKGTFVSFREGKLVSYQPFINAYYKNDLEEYNVRVEYKTGEAIPETARIYDGHLMRTRQRAGERYTAMMFRILKELENEFNIPDCDFFLNTTDWPLLQKDLKLPFPSIYGDQYLKQDDFLTSIDGKPKFAPILSFGKMFNSADIMMPTSDDWAPYAFQGEYFADNDNKPLVIDESKITYDYSQKDDKIIFRGTGTGPGYNKNTNTRMRLAYDSYKLQDPHIDIGITKPKIDVEIKLYNRIMFVKKDKYDRRINKLYAVEMEDLPFAERADIYQQSKCKYILDIDGHAAAFRFLPWLTLASTVIHIESGQSGIWATEFGNKYWPGKYWLNTHPKSLKMIYDDVSKVENYERNKKIAEEGAKFGRLMLDKTTLLSYMYIIIASIAERRNYSATQPKFMYFKKLIKKLNK